MFFHIYNNLRNVFQQLVFDNPSPSIRGKLRLLNITELFICFLAVFILVNKIILNFYLPKYNMVHIAKRGREMQYCIQRVRRVKRLSGRVLDSKSRGCRFEPHWRHHCVVSLSKTLYPLLSKYRKIHPDITEKLFTGT